MSNDIRTPDLSSIYLTPRAKLKLDSIENYSITIVEAPTGFGKTTLLKNYSSTQKSKVSWIDIRSTSKQIFWDDLCDNISDELAEQFKQIGYPQNEEQIVRLRAAVRNHDIEDEHYL